MLYPKYDLYMYVSMCTSIFLLNYNMMKCIHQSVLTYWIAFPLVSIPRKNTNLIWNKPIRD